MKHILFMGLPIVLAVLCACGGGNGKTAGEMPEPVALEKDSLAVSQILMPQQMTVKGDVALIMSWKTDTVFYAFGLPDFRFLYRQGIRGDGPDDFSFGQMVDYPSRHVFAQYEIVKHILRVFDISQKGFETKKALRVGGNSGKVLSVVNDSILILEETDWKAKKLEIYAYNCASGQVTDSLPGLKSYIKNTRIGQTISSFFNTCSIQGYGEHFVLSYYLMDRIEFYRVSPQGKISLVRGIGEQEMPEALKNYLKVDTDTRPGGDIWKTPALETVRFYYGSGGYPTRDHVFIVDKEGKTPQQESEEIAGDASATTLRIYTWDGRLRARVRLSLPCRFGGFPFAVSEEYKTIYAIDPREDFEYVYTFRYDL